MGISCEDAIRHMHSLMDKVDATLKETFQNMHQGYPSETMIRFLKARDWNVAKAYKMLVDCLQWRLLNRVDEILSKPIVPADLYRKIRDSQLVGMSGFTREGVPVMAVGAGLSTYDKASENHYMQSHIQMNEYRDRVLLPAASKRFKRRVDSCIKVLDMTGLKISALTQKRILTAISSIDDLNYPEKAEKYYIVNAPYVFSACWKAVKPLLQERTRRKVQVLSGTGKDELLQIMEYSSLPHFCAKDDGVENCFSFDHPFHQELYEYVIRQAALDIAESGVPVRQESLQLEYPHPEEDDDAIVMKIESEFQKFADLNGLSKSLTGVKV